MKIKGTCYADEERLVNFAQLKRELEKNSAKNEFLQESEICKIQLMSLIDNINTTEVNETEIAPFLDQIFDTLKDLDRGHLLRNSFLICGI